MSYSCRNASVIVHLRPLRGSCTDLHQVTVVVWLATDNPVVKGQLFYKRAFMIKILAVKISKFDQAGQIIKGNSAFLKC